MSSSSVKREYRPLLLWEAKCAAAEIAGVGLGLMFGLGFDRWLIGSVILFGVCAASIVIRFRHYTCGARPSGPA